MFFLILTQKFISNKLCFVHAHFKKKMTDKVKRHSWFTLSYALGCLFRKNDDTSIIYKGLAQCTNIQTKSVAHWFTFINKCFSDPFSFDSTLDFHHVWTHFPTFQLCNEINNHLEICSSWLIRYIFELIIKIVLQLS